MVGAVPNPSATAAMTSFLPHPVGEKVVCIHGHFPAAVFEVFDRVPEENQVYTVSEIFWAPEHGTNRPMLSVRLTELPPINAACGGFSLWRFRLLGDIKTLRRREAQARQRQN